MVIAARGKPSFWIAVLAITVAVALDAARGRTVHALGAADLGIDSRGPLEPNDGALVELRFFQEIFEQKMSPQDCDSFDPMDGERLTTWGWDWEYLRGIARRHPRTTAALGLKLYAHPRIGCPSLRSSQTL